LNTLRFGATGKPKHRHAYPTLIGAGGITRGPCACGQPFDPGAARRGRNNRARGGRAELDIARTYGGEKVGPLGLPEDIRGKSWATQVKVSQRTPPPMWLREFGKLAGGSRTPRLILRFSRQGGLPHDRTQDFVVVRGEDWLSWFGRDE
jgi:hypothetical protein